VKDAFVKGAKLEPGWIDLGIGEARLVRTALESTFGLEFFHRSTDDELDYQPSQGSQKLLDELEHLHRAPYVVTAGAKQGVFAALMVAKQRGCRRVGMRDPAWPPLVQAATSLGFKVVLCEPRDLKKFDCFLLVSPNNPDGYAHTPFELARIEEHLLAAGKFLVHDAAYTCAPYINLSGTIRPVGHIQLHSVSKRFGLSGLRVGWAVCPDKNVHADVASAVEIMSAGVSGTAQGAVARLLKRLRTSPKLASMFHEDALKLMNQARQIATEFNPQVLEADMRINEGAFAWCRKGPLYDAGKLQTLLVDGEAYGYPSHVRVNLVGGLEIVKELASRTWSI